MTASPFSSTTCKRLSSPHVGFSCWPVTSSGSAFLFAVSYAFDIFQAYAALLYLFVFQQSFLGATTVNSAELFCSFCSSTEPA